MQTVKTIFGILLLFGVGCGPAPSVNAVQADRKDPTILQIEAAKNGHLDCDFSGECEPAVALVSIATSEGLSRCSGFLISDHEVLTNDHCLASIADQENACRGLVFVHFNNNVHRDCNRVSVRSHQSGVNSKDYAVIELSAPIRDRKPLQISKRGFDNNETATIFTVQASRNPQTHTYDGKQVKLNCHASYSSIMATNISSSMEPIMTFGDCAIQEGNSGSPIFNKNGEVGAIVQGFLTIKGDEFSDLIQPFLLDGSYGEMSIATQTRCIPELVGTVANACTAVKPLSAFFPKDYLNIFGGFSDKIIPKLTNGLFWKAVKTNDSEKTFVSSPSCVSANEVRTGNLSFTSGVISYHLGINSRLQAEWRSLYAEGAKQTLFVVQKSSMDKPTSADFVSNEFGKITLPVCGR